MSTYDLRKDSRRTSITRRQSDRRVTPYCFGSTEWVENIKKNYLAWPKTERRESCRRENERREAERRLQQFSEQHRSEIKHSPILLTQEERRLIEDLYRNNPTSIEA
jgi:hypothetical protein